MDAQPEATECTRQGQVLRRDGSALAAEQALQKV